MTSRPTDPYPCLCCLYFSLIVVAVYLEVWKCIAMFTCVLLYFQVHSARGTVLRCVKAHCNVHLPACVLCFQVQSAWHCCGTVLRGVKADPHPRALFQRTFKNSLSLSLATKLHHTQHFWHIAIISYLHNSTFEFQFSVLVPLHYAEVEKQG